MADVQDQATEKPLSGQKRNEKKTMRTIEADEESYALQFEDAEITIEIARDFGEMKHFLQQVNDPAGPGFSPYYIVKARLAIAGREESDHADAQAINRRHLKQAKTAFTLAKATYLDDSRDVEKLQSLGRKIRAADRRSKN